MKSNCFLVGFFLVSILTTGNCRALAIDDIQDSRQNNFAEYTIHQWFVATDGDDISGDGSAGNPFASLGRAVEVAAFGDTVQIADGVYSGAGNCNVYVEDKSLTIRSSSNDPELCVFELGGEDGFHFQKTVSGLELGLDLFGISFHGGGMGVIAAGYFEEKDIGPQLISLNIENCNFEGNSSGLKVSYAGLQLQDCIFSTNSIVGLDLDYNALSNVDIIGCHFEQNGLGIKNIFQFSGNLNCTESVFVRNETGFTLGLESAHSYFTSCRIDSNSVDGLVLSGGCSGFFTFTDCQVRGNNRYGGHLVEQVTSLTMNNCQIQENGNHGLAVDSICGPFNLTNVLLENNGGFGCSFAETGLFLNGPDITGCFIANNCLGGVRFAGNSISIQESLIVDNGGNGLEIWEYGGGAGAFELSNSTIAGNTGTAILSDNTQATITNTIIAFNAGPAADLTNSPALTMSCNDIYGNTTDYDGDLLPHLGINGNINTNPSFCGSQNEETPYTLAQNSPCAEENNPTCGQVGALGVGCPGISPTYQWFIATDGNDETGDGSDGNPFATLSRAVDIAAFGDTIQIADGAYSGTGNCNVYFEDKSLTIRSTSNDPNLCIFELSGEDGVHLQKTGMDLEVRLNIHGISFQGGIVGATVVGFWGEDPKGPQSAILVAKDCRFEMNSSGLSLNLVSAQIENCIFIGNTGTGLYLGVTPPDNIDISGCYFEQNGTGMFGNMYTWTTLNCTETAFVRNETGFKIWSDVGHLNFTACQIDSNTLDGFQITNSDAAAYTFDSCSIVGNNRYGGHVMNEFLYPISMGNCEISGNGNHGLLVDDGWSLTLSDNIFRNNGGFGCALSTSETFTWHEIARCTFSNNQLGGIQTRGNNASLTECIIIENEGPGLEAIIYNNDPGDFSLINCTIAENAGAGLSSNHAQATIANTIIAFNSGPAATLANSPTLTMSCNNIYGNTTDYEGDLLDHLGINGNINTNPSFCDPQNEVTPYTLAQNSPCAEENNPTCGQIGALGIGCEQALSAVDIEPSAEQAIPLRHKLHQNFPNPFNPSTTISFDLPRDEMVRVSIYSLDGRLVHVLASERLAAGTHDLVWKGTDGAGRRVASGTYFCRMVSGEFDQIQKMVLAK